MCKHSAMPRSQWDCNSEIDCFTVYRWKGQINEDSDVDHEVSAKS